jgi:hypothetical protein
VVLSPEMSAISSAGRVKVLQLKPLARFAHVRGHELPRIEAKQIVVPFQLVPAFVARRDVKVE